MDKYQKFAVSFEEADWHGLSLAEALKKQAKILAIEAEKSVQPDKIKYRQQLIEDLRSGRVDDLKMMDIDSESAADQTWLQMLVVVLEPPVLTLQGLLSRPLKNCCERHMPECPLYFASSTSNQKMLRSGTESTTFQLPKRWASS